MAEFVVVAQFEVRPKDRDRFLRAAAVMADEAPRLEPGCHRFEVAADLEDQGKGLFYGIFEEAAAFEAHTETPHFAAFLEAIAGIDVRRQSTRNELSEREPAPALIEST